MLPLSAGAHVTGGCVLPDVGVLAGQYAVAPVRVTATGPGRVRLRTAVLALGLGQIVLHVAFTALVLLLAWLTPLLLLLVPPVPAAGERPRTRSDVACPVLPRRNLRSPPPPLPDAGAARRDDRLGVCPPVPPEGCPRLRLGGLRSLPGALRRAPLWAVAVVLVAAVSIGVFAPLLGISLVGFLIVDAVVGAVSRSRASRRAPA